MKIEVFRISPLPAVVETVVRFLDETGSTEVCLFFKREEVMHLSLNDFEGYAIQRAQSYLTHVVIPSTHSLP